MPLKSCEKPPTTYRCAECGEPATVVDGVVVRTCSHDHAPIVADLHATAYGEGGTDA
jgi:hypothetical protein